MLLFFLQDRSNLTNKYNPQELDSLIQQMGDSSNLTNKYNPQELSRKKALEEEVQILPINTILKNLGTVNTSILQFKSYQ